MSTHHLPTGTLNRLCKLHTAPSHNPWQHHLCHSECGIRGMHQVIVPRCPKASFSACCSPSATSNSFAARGFFLEAFQIISTDCFHKSRALSSGCLGLETSHGYLDLGAQVAHQQGHRLLAQLQAILKAKLKSF